MSGLWIPWRASRRDVTRVSSAAIAPTSPRTRTARAVTSSRLPIGVATTNNRLRIYLPIRSSPPPLLPHEIFDFAGAPGFPGGPPGSGGGGQPLTNSIRDLRRRAHESRGGWQHVEERLAVVAAEDTVVEDHYGTAVAGPADEPAEALLQPQRRLRQRELRERITHPLRASRIDRIAWHGGRQPD